jgi:Ca-activated chloride channel family protein
VNRDARTRVMAILFPIHAPQRAGACAALLLLAFASGAASQTQAPYRIAVNVDLMVLHTTVHNRKGGFPADLQEGDFVVYDGGVRQSIRLFRHEDVPVTVGLVIDHSGSMRPKLAHVIAAARTFVRSSNPEDQMFVVNFNEKVTLGLSNAKGFTDTYDEMESAILKTPAAGQTALYDAVLEALERLRAGDRDKKVLIVISDGGDNASTHKLAEVLQKAQESSAIIYTIGIFDEDDPDRNPNVLHRLARETGGEDFLPTQREEIVTICQGIARDIRHQYTIGYVPSDPAEPGAFRSIRVDAKTAGYGKLLVRTRTGYIAGERGPKVNAGAK